MAARSLGVALLALAACAASGATRAPADVDADASESRATASGPALDVTVRLEGLEEVEAVLGESGERLALAVADLQRTLEELRADPESLTPEQLRALERLVVRMDDLVDSADQLAARTLPLMEEARAPGRALVRDLALEVRTAAVDPAVGRVDAAVRGWIVLTILGLLLFDALGGFVLHLTALRPLGVIARQLRSIADDYEIVPKVRPDAAAPDAAAPDAAAPDVDAPDPHAPDEDAPEAPLT